MKTSALFKYIEKLQGNTPWGHMLDAGTGDGSLPWVTQLPTERWTAVTSQPIMAEAAQRALASPARENDRIVIGNWADEKLLAGERFDTVLLDYVIGAVDAFAPYFQGMLLRRMATCVDGALYITGLEPYVPVMEQDEVGGFVGDLGRLRDACTLLARDRPYREFPAIWVATQLQQTGFNVTDVKHFKIRRRHKFLQSQLKICEDRVQRFADKTLSNAMGQHIEQMRERGEYLIRQHDGLPYGRNYVLRAVPIR